MRTARVLIAIAWAAGLAAAPATAQAPSPRFVIDCGSLQGAGNVAFEVGGTRFVSRIECPGSTRGT